MEDIKTERKSEKQMIFKQHIDNLFRPVVVERKGYPFREVDIKYLSFKERLNVAKQLAQSCFNLTKEYDLCYTHNLPKDTALSFGGEFIACCDMCRIKYNSLTYRERGTFIETLNAK